jgi:pimeloyl-ACP methyl ester carboxylesterase
LYLQIGGLRRDPHADPVPVLRTMADVTFSDEELAAIGVPTLFVVGTDDEIFPPASIAEAAARVPGARLELVDGAGHSPYFEQPGVWNNLVRAFLRECP